MTENQAELFGQTFRHFKGNLYRLEGFAKDSKMLAEMAVYRACQAVLVAFASELGKSDEKLLRLGSGFGSGMGTMEGTCGALVGAIMVSSLLSEKGAAMTASRRNVSESPCC